MQSTPDGQSNGVPVQDGQQNPQSPAPQQSNGQQSPEQQQQQQQQYGQQQQPPQYGQQQPQQYSPQYQQQPYQQQPYQQQPYQQQPYQQQPYQQQQQPQYQQGQPQYGAQPQYAQQPQSPQQAMGQPQYPPQQSPYGAPGQQQYGGQPMMSPQGYQVTVNRQPGMRPVVNIAGVGTFGGGVSPPMNITIQGGGLGQSSQQQYFISSGAQAMSPSQITISGPVIQAPMVRRGPTPMALPTAPAGTPPGLEYLAALDCLFIGQIPQLIDEVTTVEIEQQYRCLTSTGWPLYAVQETTDCYDLQVWKSHRPFTLMVLGATGQPVLKLTRPLRLNSGMCCFILPCNFWFLQHVTVSDAQGGVLGHVTQRWTLSNAKLDLVDGRGEVLAQVQAPSWTCSCLGDIEFKVVDRKGTQIGSVTKKWAGMAREEFLNNADCFVAKWPMDAPIVLKALIFSAVLLVDFMYFEDRNKKTNSSSTNNNIGAAGGFNMGGGGASSNISMAEIESDMAAMKRFI